MENNNNDNQIDDNHLDNVQTNNKDDFKQSPRYTELEKLLTCSCCNQILLEPVTLFCQHTFCQSCIILNNEKQQLECPKCNESVVIPVSNNFQLRGIIDKIYSDDYFKERKTKFDKMLANDLKLKKKYEIYKNYFNDLLGKIHESNGKFIKSGSGLINLF